MNNIYVEGELPDNCKACQYKSIGRCILSNENVFDYMVYETCPKECPVKPLSVRLAEERKRIVQEIRDLAGDYFEMPYCDACGNTDFNDVVLTGKDLTEILDDVERGE